MVNKFKPHFLSPHKLKLKHLVAHQTSFRISKLTLLLFLVPFLKELWQCETPWHFCGDTMYKSALNPEKCILKASLTCCSVMMRDCRPAKCLTSLKILKIRIILTRRMIFPVFPITSNSSRPSGTYDVCMYRVS